MGRTSSSPAGAGGQSTRGAEGVSLADRQRKVAQTTLLLLTLLEPYPFAPQTRASRPDDLQGATWRQASTPLLRHVLRAAADRQAVQCSLVARARARLLARLRVSRRAQEQWEEAELSHGTDRWQEQLVVLHEDDVNRRDERQHAQAQQERKVARLWMKLQRQLTHQRAPWAPPPPSAEAEAESPVVLKLDKTENALRQRCRLKRVERGTRHREASTHRVKNDEKQQQGDGDGDGGGGPGGPGQASRPYPMLPSISLLPTGVELAKLCEGSDGEDWEEEEKKAERLADRRSRAAGGVGGGGGMLRGGGMLGGMDLREASSPATPEGSSSLAPLTPTSTPRDTEEAREREEEARRQTLKLEMECELVTAQRVVPGTLQLHATKLTFSPDMAKWEAQAAEELAKWERRRRGERPTDKPPKEKEWPLAGLHEVHRRRYLLRACALELFFREAPAVFVNLQVKTRRRKLLSKLQSAVPRLQVVSPSDRRWVNELVARWQARQISNFEYLQRLNTLAGRTYNDLNQYPVFPWVLADYTSDKLDLSDPATFRDLSKPMGAQRPERAREIAERYEQLKEIRDDEQPPPFHYGSHYSSAAIVLHYLIRLEPFTTLAIRLQVSNRPPRNTPHVRLATSPTCTRDPTFDPHPPCRAASSTTPTASSTRCRRRTPTPQPTAPTSRSSSRRCSTRCNTTARCR